MKVGTVTQQETATKAVLASAKAIWSHDTNNMHQVATWVMTAIITEKWVLFCISLVLLIGHLYILKWPNVILVKVAAGNLSVWANNAVM